MTTKVALSHVAILVPSVRKAADRLAKFDFKIGEEEFFDGEGTKEIYVEHGKPNSLLLMEGYKPGAYQRALQKRGPGLHHLAIDVLNLETYIESLAGTGWLLHPKSLKSIKEFATAYLARPGFPGMVEVQERPDLMEGTPFVSGISLAMDLSLSKLLAPIGQDSVVKPSNEPTTITLNGHSLALRELF
jgi:hypothetical protein